MKYPYEINGVIQEQNPIKRLLIRIWYSDWFRILFLLCPVWIIPLIILLALSGVSGDTGKVISIAAYMIPFCLGLAFNDYSNLRKIGLDEYHRKIKRRKQP